MITTNKSRIGNFTSSEIYRLLAKDRSGKGMGKPALEYIDEKNMERLFESSIDTEVDAKPPSWGKLLEGRVFSLLGLDYTLTSQETDVHPTINYWAGSKDGTHEVEGRAVTDIKCPLTRKSFYQLVKPLYDGLQGMDAMNAIRETHKDGEKYYWQLVSNAIINGCEYAELIVYMPYLSELQAIKELAEGQCYWIWAAKENELPYLKDGGYFKNINIIRFKVPEEDKIRLTDAVLAAGKLLIKRPSIILASPTEFPNTIIIQRA